MAFLAGPKIHPIHYDPQKGRLIFGSTNIPHIATTSTSTSASNYIYIYVSVSTSVSISISPLKEPFRSLYAAPVWALRDLPKDLGDLPPWRARLGTFHRGHGDLLCSSTELLTGLRFRNSIRITVIPKPFYFILQHIREFCNLS